MKKVIETTSLIINIFAKTTKDIEDDVLQKFPSYNTLREQAVKARNKINIYFMNEVEDIPKQLLINFNQ